MNEYFEVFNNKVLSRLLSNLLLVRPRICSLLAVVTWCLGIEP